MGMIVHILSSRSKEVKPAMKKLLKDVSQYTKEAIKNYKDETEDIFRMEEK